MRLLLLSAMLLTGAVRAAADPPSDTMAQRMQACTPCHGEQGRATRDGYYPRIAGKPAGYLYNQLRDFQAGRRYNATMMYLLEHMSDDYLREIARYFAEVDLPYPPPEAHAVSTDVLARGRQLAIEGDKTRDIPACTSCHGERLTGVQPAMPGLAGLPKDYVSAQLGAWRTGQRRTAAPDCMAEIAKRMSVQDVGAVATWLSMRPLSEDTKPAPSLAQKAPMDCGSGFK